MRRFSCILFFLALSLFVLFLGPARAQWIQDGAQVLDHWLSIADIGLVSDGAGGAIIAWTDYRSGTPNILCQRIDSYGNPVWAVNGVPVCSNPAWQDTPQLVSDGAEGAVIMWYDARNGNTDIYAQRMSSGGTALWTVDGIPVCSATDLQAFARISEDGYGGALIAWEDRRNGENDIYAQRINGSGTTLWTANGVGVSMGDTIEYQPRIVSDCQGGAIVSWCDYRNVLSSGIDIYAQRLNGPDGAVIWGSDIPVCTAPNDQYDIEAVSDRSCGVIITWEDLRTTARDIYAQRLDRYGIAKWTVNGVAICTASSDQMDPQIIADDAGGAIITWEDGRAGDKDIYAQAIDIGGIVQWTADGVAICTAAEYQSEPRLALDMNNGAIITWSDYRFAYSDIYVQRIDAGGTVQWATNGVILCGANSNQAYPQITTDGDFGAIVAWPDYRDQGHDIYAQRIERNGYWGYPAPRISSIRDVPGDQGGYVNLSWDASRLDIWPEDHISHYTIWRAISGEAAALMLEGEAVLIEGTSGFLSLRDEIRSRLESTEGASAEVVEDAPGNPPVIIRRETLAAGSYYWTYVATVNSSYYVDTYAETVPTLFDSTASSDEYHYFQVIAHESDPTGFWISAPDSGYSVDNLSPCPPLGVAAEQSFVPEGLEVSWDPNGEADLDGYVIYRGTAPDFTPEPGNLLAAPCDTFYFDADWRWDSGYWYKLAAVDVHGNESDVVIIGPDLVTGDEVPTMPAEMYLAQNYPNPFNPATTIRFGLQAPAEVNLRIYDAAGRLVRVLVDEPRDAGHYIVGWDGRDGGGRCMASGVYFYRLVAGDFAQTKKMVLLQ